MRQLKRLIGSWNRRDLIFVAVVFAAIGIYTVVPYFRSQPIILRDIGTSIGMGVVFLLMLRLRKIAKRTPPPPRVKYTVSMALIEIVNEFVYTGYRVEAMTEDTVVLVRFSIRDLIGSALIIILMPLVWIMASQSIDSPQALATTAVLISLLSLYMVYMYTIAGYGYDRITFHQRSKSAPSTCVTFVNSFLPSRVKAAVESEDDHGDEAWYKDELDRL